MATTSRRTAARLHLLTAKQVQHAPEGDLSDGGGLLLRVRGSSASWVFRFTAPSGKRREMGLGVCHRGSPGQAGDSLTGARDAAHKGRELLRSGIDPLKQKEDARQAEREAELARKADKARDRRTLARCARDYHERAIEPRLSSKHSAQWIASLENHVPAALWHKPIADVTAPELLAALAEVKPHERARNLPAERVHETLTRIRQRLDAVFEDAIFHRYCDGNPAAAIRRKLREAMPRQKPGQFAALPFQDAPAFLAQLRDAQGTAARCLEFAVLCAARTSEALLATWSEFDLEAGVWTVPAERMKGEEEHVVFLSERAIAILQGQAGLHASLVFPSTVLEDKPMSNMAMLAVLDRLQMRGCTTVHGLCRSTFSTWANETAAARPDVIEACLAHKEQDKVRAAYNRAQFNLERRALLAAWAAYLERPAAQVLTFERAA
ncbi:phage integrase central domain-containing protein [Roseateles asaccharophilus]|uniref:Integrase n=1 Tax=Roseateles asaccharophilus TaxID=582607 RepID=A0ABU2A463_9BURK|nr:integrase arm-type DNA-binding domain-containing protein [Roseateles asaccharophilus]MDR7331982.1 integrase [Roseateles asaccharophilus]